MHRSGPVRPKHTPAAKLRQCDKQFWSARQAIAATEFALVLPILVILMLGSVEAARLIISAQRVTQVATTIVEMLSQTQAQNPNETGTGIPWSVTYPKSAIRFLFTQTLRTGEGIFSPFCVSEWAPLVRYALRRRFRSRPGAFWGVLAAAPPPTPTSWRQRRRECRTRDHDVSGMTHPSCMKRAQRSRIAVNTASIVELIFKNVCLPCRTILPAV